LLWPSGINRWVCSQRRNGPATMTSRNIRPGSLSGVLGRPGLGERTDAKSNLYSRAWLFYRASAFYDTGIFPWRSEPRKRVWLGVPGVNNLCGGGHLAAINEQFAHKAMITVSGLNTVVTLSAA
jgi:hypothetical protein